MSKKNIFECFQTLNNDTIEKWNQQLKCQSQIPKFCLDCFLESVSCKVFPICTACVVTYKINKKLMSQQNYDLKTPKFKF